MFDNCALRGITAALRSHFWFVGRNDTAHPLYISDSPVVRIPHAGNEHAPQTGLTSPGIEVALPFSPRYVLFLCERTHFTALAGRDGGIQILTDEAVRHYNAAQVMQCCQRVFCSADDFDLAREMAARFPDDCAPGRERFEQRGPGFGESPSGSGR